MELETKVREDFKITETSSESYLYLKICTMIQPLIVAFNGVQ